MKTKTFCSVLYFLCLLLKPMVLNNFFFQCYNCYVTEQKMSNDLMPCVITVTQKNGRKENLGWKTKESLIEWHSAIDDVTRKINKTNQQVCDVIKISTKIKSAGLKMKSPLKNFSLRKKWSENEKKKSILDFDLCAIGW